MKGYFDRLRILDVKLLENGLMDLTESEKDGIDSFTEHTLLK